MGFTIIATCMTTVVELLTNTGMTATGGVKAVIKMQKVMLTLLTKPKKNLLTILTIKPQVMVRLTILMKKELTIQLKISQMKVIMKQNSSLNGSSVIRILKTLATMKMADI